MLVGYLHQSPKRVPGRNTRFAAHVAEHHPRLSSEPRIACPPSRKASESHTHSHSTEFFSSLQGRTRDSPPGTNRSKFRSGWCPRRETGPKDAGLTSSHARVGYRITRVSSRGCLALARSERRSCDRLITGHEGSPPGPASNLGRLQKDSGVFCPPNT